MKKAVKIIIVLLVVLLGGLISIPFIFKDKILALTKAEINKNINATVDFKEFDLTIISSFPNLTLSLDELTVIGTDAFAGDTLASIPNFSVTLDIMSVISGGEINISGFHLNQPRLQLLVLADGKANWDIVKSTDSTDQTTTEPSQFKVGLKKYSVKDGNVIYDDASLGFSTVMEGMNHEGKGDFTADLFTLVTETAIEKLTVTYEGIPYLLQVKSNLTAELEMDMVNSKYTFKQNELSLNELQLAFDGYVAMPGDDIETDIKFDVKQSEFRNFISMIPGVFRDGFDNVKSEGKLLFNGFVKGIYNETSMPGFGITLNIQNGMFQYPSLPSSLNNVQVDLNISNPDGKPDHTLINLKKLHVEIGKEPFDARLIVKTPVSDADIDLWVKGRVNFENIGSLVPLEKGTELKGTMVADLTAKGRMSAIEKKRYEDFNASGSLNLISFNYKSPEFKQGISIPACELIFNPKNVTLNQFEMQSGNTDIKATGWLDNLLAYTFKENELLKGTLDIKSNTIDLNELSGEPASTTQDTIPATVFEVPEFIDFLITASAGKIIYDDLTLYNFKGNVAIRDQALGVNGLSFGLLDGLVTADGLYETKNIKSPTFFMDFNIIKMDVQKTYSKFVAVRTLAPIAEKCSGKFSSTINVKGTLNDKMEPVYESMNGVGKLSTTSLTVDNFAPLVKVADAVKMDQFKKLNVNDVNLSFKIENGRVYVAPFDVNLAGINSKVQGSNGFDQSIDYTMAMKIPTALMGSQANAVVTGLINKANQSAGSNLSMGKEVNVTVRIGGTVTNPTVETGMKDMASSAVTDIKTQVKEQFDEKKKELEDKAKAEADRLKKEAEDKVRSEADRLKKEAEEKAKAEADRLKKEAENRAKKEAEDKLKNLFGKPKK